jgi:hypothetical protein
MFTVEHNSPTMEHAAFRRGVLSKEAKDMEAVLQELDPYLYVDVKHREPGQLEVWRNHPTCHLPLPILDIPNTASVKEVLFKLKTMDNQGVDIGRENAILSDQKARENKKKKRHEAEAFAFELGKYIQKTL